MRRNAKILSMAQNKNYSYTSEHALQSDGGVTFVCSIDQQEFPWLALHLSDVIPVQMMCFFASYETAQFHRAVEEGQWTALTKMTWRCDAKNTDVKHFAMGSASPPSTEGRPDFGLSFSGPDGTPILNIQGTGVTFRNRDFGAWRSKNRDSILELPEPAGFKFAEPAAAGVTSVAECIVSPLIEGSEFAACDALITAINGFPPAHPYHDGSGDHVNATHQADAARQFASLLRPEFGARACSGGEMEFSNYVELDRPFRITENPEKSTPTRVASIVEQGGKICSQIALDFDGVSITA